MVEKRVVGIIVVVLVVALLFSVASISGNLIKNQGKTSFCYDSDGSLIGDESFFTPGVVNATKLTGKNVLKVDKCKVSLLGTSKITEWRCKTTATGEVKLQYVRKSCDKIVAGSICNSAGTACVNPNLPSCTDTCSSLGYSCGVHNICGKDSSCGSCMAGYDCVGGNCIYSGGNQTWNQTGNLTG